MTASLDEAYLNFSLDAPGDLSSPFYMLVGDNIWGLTSSTSDLDVYAIHIDIGSNYSIIGVDNSNFHNTYFNVYDRYGNFVYSSVDFGPYSGISFYAADSLYYVAFFGGGPGFYGARLTNNTVTEINGIGQQVFAGIEYFGALDYASDSDHFTFQAVAGRTYAIVLNSQVNDIFLKISNIDSTYYKPVTLLAKGGGVYTFTPAVSGNFDLTLSSNSFYQVGAYSFTAFEVDTTSPTATVTISDTFLSVGETAQVAVTFSEAVTDFSNTDVTADNGSLSTFATIDGGVTWTATYTPNVDVEDTTNLIRLAASYTDLAGNAGATANSTNFEIDTLPNRAPTVTATQSVTTSEDTAKSVTVSASDVDGDTLSWSAGAASHGTVSGGTNGVFTYTPDADYAGSDSFTVTVSDGQGGSAQQVVSVTVSPVEDEATGSVNVGGTVAEGGTVSASVSATDVDGAITSTAYQWQVSANGTDGWSNISGATSSSYAIASDQSEVGKYLRVVATTTDALGGTTTFSSAATLAIANVNDAPVVANAIADQSTAEDSALTYKVPAGTFVDVDNTTLTYSAALANGDPLPTWLSFDSNTLTFSGTTPQNFAGDLSLTVTASDGSLSVSDTFAFSVKAVNDAPVGFGVTISGDASEDKTLSANASVTSDADGLPDPLRFTYQWQSSAGGSNWSDISGATSGQFTPGDAYVGLQLRVITTYTDNQGTAETAISAATLAIANVNDAPVVATAIADQSSPENVAWSYQLPAGAFSDVDGDALTYSATLADGGLLPAWLSFDAATCTFSGTPPQDFNGDITLRVTASDGTLSASDTFVLTIEPPLQFVAGTAGNDTLTGVAGKVSEITGGGSNDAITGGSRADVAVYSGNRSDYTITTVAGVTTVRDNRTGSPDGTDTLRGMNILRFADLQLFQTAAANKVTLAGQAQTYAVANSEVVQGTNAAEHFIVAPKTSALVFAGNNDVVDLSGAIDSYTFSKTGTQLQISDGTYTTTLSVGGSFTLRTASGSTSVAIDFTQGGAIKLGGTQIVGSATFDPIAAILDPSNVPSTATSGSLQTVTGTSGNDTLTGVAGKVSEITGGGGNDAITGGSRADVAVYSGNRSDYTITTVAGVTTVRDNRTGSPDGTDTLRGMNILRFADLQLFQTAAANKVTLAGQAQTFAVANSEVVQGTNAAEHFIVAPKTSALVFAGNNDVVDLSGAIDSYTFSKTGTQLQISDGIYTTTLSVGGSFTLRTASGSTSVAIDFTQGGAIKLGGTQIVGSATFDPIAAILDPDNYSDNAEFRQITVNSDASYNGHEGIVDVFVIDASQSLTATIAGFEDGDILEFRNHSEELGVSFQNTVFNDDTATLLAGSATITLTSLANDNFSNEASFEDIYGAGAIGYVM